MNTPNIPQISFELIKQKDNLAIQQLTTALQEYGFVTFTDHGLDESILEDAYAASKEFFRYPMRLSKIMPDLTLVVLEGIPNLEKKLL